MLMARSRPFCALLVLAALDVMMSDFQQIEFLPNKIPCNATLTTSVPFQCQASLAADQQYVFWKASLDFNFGIITEAEWKSLVKLYTEPWAAENILVGNTPLFETFNATRSYSLTDFLPVIVRALRGHYFKEEEDLLPDGQPLPPPPPAAPHLYNKSVLVPNCWATVYEFLRTMTQCRRGDANIFHEVYSTGDVPAQNWLNASTSPMSGSYIDHQRRFGDVMLVYLRDPQMKRAILEHTVVFVDHNVVFEKAGTGDKNPYRLIDVTTVEREWKPTRLGGIFEWELRRPYLGSDQLQSFRDRFSLASQRKDSAWPEFWQWPPELKKQFTLGVADNPRNPGEIDGLTLLQCRRYNLKKLNGQWRPVKRNLPWLPETVIV